MPEHDPQLANHPPGSSPAQGTAKGLGNKAAKAVKTDPSLGPLALIVIGVVAIAGTFWVYRWNTEGDRGHRRIKPTHERDPAPASRVGLTANKGDGAKVVVKEASLLNQQFNPLTFWQDKFQSAWKATA